MKTTPRILAVTALLLAAAPLAPAASLTWNGGASGTWSDGGAGWLNGVTPTTWNNATPDAAIFSGTAPTSVDVSTISVGNMTFSSGNYSLSNGTLTLNSSIIDIASGLTTTLGSALAGSTGLTKSGAGTLVLSGTNKNYTGTTTINGGAIQISAVGAGTLGSSASAPVTLDGGALYANFASNLTPGYAITVGASGGEIRNLSAGRWVFGSNVLNGSGTLTLSFGTGAVRFGATGTGTTQTGFSGKWVVNGNGGNAANGFFDLYAEQNLGTGSGDDFLTLSNGGKVLFRGMTFSKGITIGTGGGQIANSGGGNTVISGKLSGAAGNDLIIDLGGSSTSNVTLSNTGNAWLGTTTLSTQGNLRLGAAGVLPDAGGNIIFSNSSAVLDLNSFSEAVGGISGSGIIDNTAASTSSVLTAGGNNQSTSFTGILRNSGSGASLALVKSGTGTLTLSNSSNSYSGGTTVAGGILQVDNAAALGSGDVVLNASSGVSGTGNRAQLWLNGVTVTGKTVTMNATTNRPVLLATGVAGATWNGTVTLAGSAGANGNPEFTNNVGNGPLTVAGVVNGSLGAGSLTLRGTSSSNLLQATVSIGSTGIEKTDGGTWTIASSGNTWGATTISMGTLLVGVSDALPTASNLSMAAGTKLDLGSTYSLGGSRSGTLALTGNATIDFGLAGTGQTMAFGASNALSWGSFQLTISNWESGSDLLRFGLNSSGLTAGQLAGITFTGYSLGAQIDSLGYLTPVPEPAAWTLIALGLTAAVVLRRRRGTGL